MQTKTKPASPAPRKRGFQLLSPERMAEIASIGGKTAHKEGRAHQFTSEEAREAGRRSWAMRQQRAST